MLFWGYFTYILIFAVVISIVAWVVTRLIFKIKGVDPTKF